MIDLEIKKAVARYIESYKTDVFRLLDTYPDNHFEIAHEFINQFVDMVDDVYMDINYED